MDAAKRSDYDDLSAAEFIASLEGSRQCLRCGNTYREIDNLGTHRCFYHPLLINGYITGRFSQGHYECCGRYRHDRTTPLGCTPCDHTSQAGHEPTRCVDPHHCEMLGLVPNENRRLEKTGKLIIYRFSQRPFRNR